MDWKGYILNSKNFGSYTDFYKPFSTLNNEEQYEILSDIIFFMNENPQLHNIPIEFLDYMIKQNCTDEIVKLINDAVIQYSDYYQYVLLKNLDRLYGKSDRLELLNSLEDLYKELKQKSSLVDQSDYFDLIHNIIELNNSKNSDRNNKLKNDIKTGYEKVIPEKLISTFVELLQMDLDLVIKYIFRNSLFNDLKEIIEKEALNNTALGEQLKSIVPEYFKSEVKKNIDFSFLEDQNYYPIKTKLVELGIEKIEEELFEYLSKKRDSKIWGVIPFIKLSNQEFVNEGHARLTEKIANHEHLGLQLNLFVQAETDLSQKYINQFFVYKHPERIELLEKIMVDSNHILLKPDAASVFLEDVLSNNQFISHLNKFAFELEAGHIQHMINEILLSTKEPDLSKVLQYLSHHQFRIEEGLAENILSNRLLNDNTSAESAILFNFLIENCPSLFMNNWKYLSDFYKINAFPVLVEQDPDFMEKLQNEINSLSDFIQIQKLFNSAGIQGKIDLGPKFFTFITQEMGLLQEDQGTGSWKEFLQVTEDLGYSSIIWANTFPWLQLNSNSVEKLFEASCDVYGYEKAAGYHLSIFSMLKQVNDQLAEVLLQTMSAIGIRSNRRYTQTIMRNLKQEDYQNFMYFVVQDSSAYYEQYLTVKKEKEREIERIAGLLSSKLEPIEILISEKMKEDQFIEVLETLKHYLGDFWEGLKDFNLYPVEEVNNLGNAVEYDSKKHIGIAASHANGEPVLVKNIGIRIGKDFKKLAQVSAIEEMVERV